MQAGWAIGALGLVVGFLMGLYIAAWQEPSNSNECVMEKLSDMQNSEAVISLYQLCRWRHGDFDRGEDAKY